MTSTSPRNGRGPKAAVAGTPFQPCQSCFNSFKKAAHDMPPEFWSDIAGDCRHITLGPREPFLEAGNGTNSIYRVAQGTLSELRFTPDGRRQIVRFLHRGDLFGRLRLVPYTHAVVAVTAAEVCAFQRDVVTRLMAKYPKAETAFLTAVEGELSDAERHIDLLGKGKAAERLAGFLLDLLPHGPGADEITVNMTRADIADYLGISTETVSRLFTQFTEEGLVQPLDRQRFQVAQQGLRDLAQD